MSKELKNDESKSDRKRRDELSRQSPNRNCVRSPGNLKFTYSSGNMNGTGSHQIGNGIRTKNTTN